METGSTTFTHDGPDLNEILSELQTQLNKERAKVEGLEATSNALTAKEGQLRVEFRKAESRKTAKAAELAAKTGMVKKKEAMYLDQKAQRDKLIAECCHLDDSTKNLKIENKSALEDTVHKMLDCVIAEKEICQLVLCGKENTQKMLTNMDAEIDKLSSLMNKKNSNEEIVHEAPNALEYDVKVSGSEVKSLNQQVEQMNNEIIKRKCEFENLMNSSTSDEIESLKQSIAVANRKLMELKHTN